MECNRQFIINSFFRVKLLISQICVFHKMIYDQLNKLMLRLIVV